MGMVHFSFATIVNQKFKQMYRLSKRSLRRLKGVEPIMIAIFVEGIKDSPYDFGIPRHGGLRTPDEQFLLYQQRPRITTKDGFKKKSYHQSGMAVDIYAFVDGKPTWETKYYKPIADHLKKVAKEKFNVTLEWGGDWKTFVDLPHFQIKKNQI